MPLEIWAKTLNCSGVRMGLHCSCSQAWSTPLELLEVEAGIWPVRNYQGREVEQLYCQGLKYPQVMLNPLERRWSHIQNGIVPCHERKETIWWKDKAFKLLVCEPFGCLLDSFLNSLGALKREEVNVSACVLPTLGLSQFDCCSVLSLGFLTACWISASQVCLNFTLFSTPPPRIFPVAPPWLFLSHSPIFLAECVGNWTLWELSYLAPFYTLFTSHLNLKLRKEQKGLCSISCFQLLSPMAHRPSDVWHYL